jgi:hypothetical protein
LSEYPVVVLHGARQTGKTTLTQFAAIGQHRSYLTLDDFDVLERAQQDPASLFLGREQITLDEVQRQPSLLLAIKRAVDQQRQAGRFLLTGSANLLPCAGAGRRIRVSYPVV